MVNNNIVPQVSSAPFLLPSHLESAQDFWYTSPTYIEENLKCSPEAFLSAANALLRNPNLNSTHLFRADIVWDSAGELKTPSQLECQCNPPGLRSENESSDVATPNPWNFTGFSLKRTVVRTLIPRKPQLDKMLDQTCYVYKGTSPKAKGVSKGEDGDARVLEQWLVVYRPHVSTVEDVPWYHPPVRAIAFSFERRQSSTATLKRSLLSLHILPFESVSLDPVPDRLHRTLLSLLHTHFRLCRNTPEPSTNEGDLKSSSNPFKDNIVPQHSHQNTYTRLKETYAAQLIADWVEKTEPSKHVFEDLSIAAFLIELWRYVYDIEPKLERQKDERFAFPGFVDVACGNGVLVHVLVSEGYHGWGFDARSRRTWKILPESTQAYLKEMLCIPKPFNDILQSTETITAPMHDGIFPTGTFIISNHADELTPWTPLLAALSCLEKPSPFLAIPCCSHALSGAKHRYQHATAPRPTPKRQDGGPAASDHGEQPLRGDLKALRAAKERQSKGQGQGQGKPQDSTYGSLCQHVQALAETLGYDVEKTLLRIPSTRNIGLLGRGRMLDGGGQQPPSESSSRLAEKIDEIVAAECKRSSGLELEQAARLWYERGLGLQRGQGRGKLKGGGAGH